MTPASFSAGPLAAAWRQAVRLCRRDRVWRVAPWLAVLAAVVAAGLRLATGTVPAAVAGPLVAGWAVLALAVWGWPLRAAAVARKLDGALGGGDSATALATWPAGRDAAWRELAERLLEQRLAEALDWPQRWSRDRRDRLSPMAWVLALVLAAWAGQGGAVVAVPGADDPPAAGGELAAATDPRTAEEPGRDVELDSPAATAAADADRAAVEAELAAALVALQAEVARQEQLLAEAGRWEEVAEAMAEMLLQWEGEDMAAAAAAAEARDWAALADALSKLADPGADGDSGSEGGGGRRPQPGAEGAATAAANRLAAALARAGDVSGAEAAQALARAGEQGGDGASEALSRLSSSARQGEAASEAGAAAGAALGLAEGLRQALADFAAGGEGNDGGDPASGSQAGNQPGGTGEPAAEIAAQLWNAWQEAAATTGPAEQRTREAALADALRAMAEGEARLVEQGLSRAPGEIEVVPRRHRVAVERYFEARRQAGAAQGGGGGR